MVRWQLVRRYSVGIFLLATIALALAACGRGGGDPTAQAPTATPFEVAGPGTPGAPPPSTPPSSGDPQPAPTATAGGAGEVEPTPAPLETTVEIRMRDHVYEFDASQIVGGRVVTFQVVNNGLQPHEMILVRVTADEQSLLNLLQSASSPGQGMPEGMELIGETGPVAPNTTSTLKLSLPLEPGRYAMASLLPDEMHPDRVLQAFKGMVAEFAVHAAS